MTFADMDMAGCREQILANARMAFPFVTFPGGHMAHKADNFSIITRFVSDQDEYEARVVFARGNRTFIVGSLSENEKDALLSLLTATSELIGTLFDERKLKYESETSKWKAPSSKNAYAGRYDAGDWSKG